MKRKSWALAIAVLLVSIIAIPWIIPARAESHWGANYFPNVTLTTQDGKQVKFYDDLIKGKVVAIELFYTQCLDICPLETARLAQVQQMLGDRVGKDIFFYSLSIDPERDTPGQLKAFAEKYHAGPGWTFLTGKKEDIELISKKLGLYRPPDPSDRDGHEPHLLIGNEATGQWLRNNAVDNPRFLSILISDWLNSWQNKRAMPTSNYAEAPRLKMDAGQYLFATQCGACHTIGRGDNLGPDLMGVTNVREHKWLERKIAQPDALLAEGDPLTQVLFERYKQIRMPNLHLDREATNLLISFMEKQSAAPPHPDAPENKSGQPR